MATTPITLAGQRWISVLLLLLCVADLSVQQHDPIKDFCRRFGHQTALVDRKLYIDGGLVNWNSMVTDPANYTSKPNQHSHPPPVSSQLT